MNDKIYVKPDKFRLINLLAEVAEGKIQIPLFQRDFVWESKQVKDLFDSIAKGYPIGSLLFWNPDEKYPVKSQIGAYNVSPKEKNFTYVLDGSQRITTLFNVLANPKNLQLADRELLKKRFTVFYDLKKREFITIKSSKDKKYHYISLFQIVDTYEFLDFMREIEMQSFDKDENRVLIDNAKALTKIFYDYEIPYVEIKGGNIKSAVEIFSRVNSTGTEISEDFMLSARSYNVNSDFIFREEISKFLTSLQKYNFENLSRDTILNCISNAKDKIYFEIKTEDLLDNLAEMTINAFEQIEKAVKFLYERLHVLHAKLLPYPTQLIFLANFFRLNPHPREEQLKKLEDWFWITTYSNYFTLYSLSQQRSAHNIFCEFAKEKHDNGIFVLNDKFNVAEFPKKLDFTGVRTKALQLFLLNSVLKNKELQLYETVKEFVIFEKEGKRPANMLLRLSSEFEVDKSKKDTGAFISKNETVFLQDYFINEKIKILFEQNMTSEFLQERDKLISEAESQFINTFNEFLDCE